MSIEIWHREILRKRLNDIFGPRFALFHRFNQVATLACLFLTALSTMASAQNKPATEYQVKAAFLYNFAKFVDWPSAAFANDKAPITVCIYGKDPFGATLDDTVRSKTIGARGFVIRRTKFPRDLAACQIAYLGDSVGDQLRDVLSILETSSVLSVGEDSHFAEQGGDVQFVMEDGKIRFLINMDSVNRAGFKMSSKLLALAKLVHDPK